jgi:cell division protein FtsI (penicillin-binding protein 3)
MMIDRRIGLLFASFLLLLVLVVVRAAWVQGVQGAGLSADARSQQTETVPVPGLRGAILDRKGRELAVSEDAADVVATPYQVKDPERMAERLAPILNSSDEEILKALASGSEGFAYLAREVKLSTAGRIRKLDLPGISTVPASRRLYPEGRLAGQVIGTVGVDGQGLSGLEGGDDAVLAGTNGEQQIVLDGLGDAIQRDTVAPASDGQDVRLTIDSDIQARTEQVLAGVAKAYQPVGATAIVMNPKSGQLLAMANWPTVDPADPSEVDPEELQNMATGFTYEPGSTFKAFTVSSALMEKLVTPTTMFNLPVELQVADREITDSHERGPVSLTVAQILAQSSNVGAATIGLEVGGKRFYEWIRRFGFGDPTGIDFPGEERGIVPTPSEFSGSTMGNLPIGQGLAVTPMQMAAGYAAIANGGILRPPQLVLEEGGERVPRPKGHRVISSKTAAQVKTMLEGVLAPGGTASEVSVPGYTLAGKTGTAEVAENGGYSETKFVASFVGFAPAADPKLLVTVVVNQPQGDIYGGTVAAPAFGEIAKFAFQYLHIPPDQAGG